MPTRNREGYGFESSREGVFTSVDEVSVSRQRDSCYMIPETFGIRLLTAGVMFVNDTVSTGFEQNLGFNGRK